MKKIRKSILTPIITSISRISVTAAEWKVTYVYIEGYYPEHSGGCYEATYEKL